jgi:hypothetical protein
MEVFMTLLSEDSGFLICYKEDEKQMIWSFGVMKKD